MSGPTLEIYTDEWIVRTGLLAFLDSVLLMQDNAYDIGKRVGGVGGRRESAVEFQTRQDDGTRGLRVSSRQ